MAITFGVDENALLTAVRVSHAQSDANRPVGAQSLALFGLLREQNRPRSGKFLDTVEPSAKIGDSAG
jgi:hypothetical protein